jgi:hypothetical protein
MVDKHVTKLKILDLFHQEADDGIPAHYCVQYAEEGKTFVEYEYFTSLTEAREFAAKHGYEG